MESTFNKHLYHVWNDMKRRCYNKKRSNYNHYGGRGIGVCDTWRDNAKSFYVWAVDNGYEEGLSIERIDNNGDYAPDNCKWVTHKEQQSNKRTNRLISLNGRTQTLKQWTNELNIRYGTILQRITVLGWSPEKALSKPITFSKKREKINHG